MEEVGENVKAATSANLSTQEVCETSCKSVKLEIGVKWVGILPRPNAAYIPPISEISCKFRKKQTLDN